MTIRKEDVCSWYSNLAPASRIDFLSGFLRLLLPWELRFVGSCLEDLARRDFHVFREAELRANTMSVMQRISSLYSFTSDEFRALLAISLALLHSTNVQCATLYSDVLIWNFELARELVRYDQVSREDIILLYNLAVNHPAFTFDQRQTLCHLLQMLKQIEVEIPPRSPSHQDDNNSCHIKRTADNNIHVMAIKLQAPEKNDSVISTDQYLFEVTWENNEVTNVKKNFAEMCDFHEKLIGRISHDERSFDVQLPEIDADHLFGVEEASDDVWVSLVKFVSFLTHLPLHILHSEEVTHFFSGGVTKLLIGQDEERRLLHEANDTLLPAIEREATMSLSQQPPLPGDCGPSHSARSSSCGSPNNYSLLSLNSSLDMPRHSSTGSSPLSTPPSSSDGRNAPRLREDAFTEEKFGDVIGLTEDTKRLHLNDANDSSKASHAYHSDNKRSWNRNPSSYSNHKAFLSMESPDDVSFSSRDVLTNPSASKSSCQSAVISPTASNSTLYHQRLAVWLKANRMHKYLDRLRKYPYEKLLLLDRPILQQEGFTLGAINKLMGMLEELKRNPDSFNSPVSVASASHRCSSESSKSASSSEASIAGCGGSNNPSPATSVPGSPTPNSHAIQVVATTEQGVAACTDSSKLSLPETEHDERVHMTDVGIEASLPDDENDLDPKNGLDGQGSDIAVSCNDVFETIGPLSPVVGEAPPTSAIPPLIMPTVPSVHQPQMMIMYPGPSNFYYASPLHMTSPQHQQQSMGSSMMSSIGSSGDFSNSGSASRPSVNSAPYYYYALPGPTPVQNIMPMAPPSRSRQHPVATATVSSPQPSPVVPGQSVSTGASPVTPGMLLLRPGSAVQTNSSMYGCSCPMCQQQQQQQQTSNSQSQPTQHQTHPQSSQVNVSSIVVPQTQQPQHQHSQQQQQQQQQRPQQPQQNSQPPPQQPSQHLPHRPHQESQPQKNQQQPQQQQAYYWQNGITYACSNVSYPCCVPPGGPVQPTPVAEPAVPGFIPQPGAPLIPYPGQNHYYPSHMGFGAGGYYSPYPMHPGHQFGTLPGQRRQRTCYNCGVAGHKSAECQEKTIDTLMSDNYFHLKYQPTEPYGMLHSTNPGLNATSVGGPSVSVEP